MVEGGRSGEHRAWGNIAVEPGLGDGYDAVADVAVPGDPDLAGQDDVFADVGGSGQPHLGAQQRVFTHRRAVPHLHQVIDLDAVPNARGAYAGSVDAGVGLDLDAIA